MNRKGERMKDPLGGEGVQRYNVFMAVYQIWYISLVLLIENSYLCKKNKIMAVLNFTSREFRSQQAHVFELADQGEKVIIRRNKKQAYTLVPVSDDDFTITPELQARIDKARAEIKAGECITVRGREELNAYLASL